MEKYITPNIKENLDSKGNLLLNLRWGAIFCIHRNYVYSRSLDYYKDLLKQLDTNDCEVGHYFERAWFYIFNCDKFIVINNPEIVIVGAGLSGCTVAEQLSKNQSLRILILE